MKRIVDVRILWELKHGTLKNKRNKDADKIWSFEDGWNRQDRIGATIALAPQLTHPNADEADHPYPNYPAWSLFDINIVTSPLIDHLEYSSDL